MKISKVKQKKIFRFIFFLLNRCPPRPSPTIQKSTQRTIVYMQESSHFRYEKTDLFIINYYFLNILVEIIVNQKVVYVKMTIVLKKNNNHNLNQFLLLLRLLNQQYFHQKLKPTE